MKTINKANPTKKSSSRPNKAKPMIRLYDLKMHKDPRGGAELNRRDEGINGNHNELFAT